MNASLEQGAGVSVGEFGRAVPMYIERVLRLKTHCATKQSDCLKQDGLQHPGL